MAIPLSSIFEYLSFGELSSIYSGGMYDGEEIPPEHYKKITSHINLGLVELCKRFHLFTDEVIVETYEHIELYKLRSEYARSNTLSTQPYKYIIDSPIKPFTDNILKIEQIYNECGELVCLNDPTCYKSIYTPSFDRIQVPLPENGMVLGIQYKARHVRLIVDQETDPDDILINIPEGLIEALLLYVAYRVFSTMNTDQIEEGNNYYKKFEASCAKAKEVGVEIKLVLRALSDESLSVSEERVQLIRRERRRLAAALADLPQIEQVWPSDANFILVQAKDGAAMLQTARKAGILLRSFPSDPALTNCVRITIGRPQDNDQLLQVLAGVAPDGR